jgi:NDP-sugar pyrophosphorylase family protein
MDFPSLVHNLLANERIVKAYIFDGYWLDIGRPEDYEQANIEIEKISGQLGIG